jgi:hypothetical protein
MATADKIFLCWSKTRSKTIAKAWAALLPQIVEGIRPIVSTEFEKGKPWAAELRRDLDDARSGIVFLTPENVDAPWIHFEAGALATAVGLRGGDVFTYVYGFNPGRLTGPLSAYQSTLATRDDTQRLVRDLCAALERQPPDEKAYAAWWPKLEKELDNVRGVSVSEIVPEFAGLFGRKTFQEPLPDCANQRWLDRFAVARATHQALVQASRRVEDLSRPGTRELYRELVAAVDGYAMAMSGFLVTEKRFAFDDDGKLAAPKGAIAACELRRRRVNDLAALLADPVNETPVFAESVGFEQLAPEQRKSVIHRWEAWLEGGHELPVRGDWQPIALSSDYDFDRIAAYVYVEKRRPAETPFALDAVRREIERRRIQPKGSYMPLHYSLRALGRWAELQVRRSEVEEELRIVHDFLIGAGKQKGSPLFLAIDRVRGALGAAAGAA